MKKLILVILLLLSLSTTVSAHPGGTDSQGGHHDGDDYHYHHGYPAHDHYDIDGDGDIDCPYDFHDNVDHDFGIHPSSSSDSYEDNVPIYTVPNTGANQIPSEGSISPNEPLTPKTKESLGDQIYNTALLIFVALILLGFVVSFFSKKVGEPFIAFALILFFLLMLLYPIKLLLD